MSMLGRWRLILWGMVFAFLDFRFNAVNVLPDAPGCLLLIIGCGGLVNESGCFRRAQWLAAWLGVLSLWPEWYLEDLAKWIGYASSLLSVSLMWTLLGAVMDFTEARQGTDLARRASRLRWIYLAITLSLWTLIGISDQSLGAVLGGMIVIGVICILAVLVLILNLIGRVRRELTNHPAENLRTRGSVATAGLATVVLMTLLLAGWVRVNSGYQSQTTSGANFHAQSEEENQRMNERLTVLLREKGFTEAYQPDGMDRFSGLHMEGEQERWLKSSQEEFKGISLRIQMGKSDISVSAKWEHMGFQSDATRRHRKALQLLLDMARWFRQQPEKDDAPENVSEFGIQSLEQALEKLPE